jgi:hypothetical protein
MKTLFKSFSAGTLSLASLSAIAMAPVSAASLTNAAIGGSAPSDYFVYDVNLAGTNTTLVPSNLANVQKVLDGNATSPTGNVELAASSEQPSFDFSKNTTLQGNIGGKSLVLSSLTATDWFGTNTAYGASNLANTWFNAFLTAAGQGNAPTGLKAVAYNTFFGLKGFQRTSDPNISYVNQNDATGLISIGLAGHLNLIDAYGLSTISAFGGLLPPTLQASEVVKYTYDNNQTGYLYSFQATNSGLVSDDGTNSHNANYEVTFQGARPVPVPAAFVGIAVAAAIGAVKLKRSKA